MPGERFDVVPDTVDEARIAPAHEIEVYRLSMLNPLAVKRTPRDCRKVSLFGKAGAPEPIQEMIACRRIT